MEYNLEEMPINLLQHVQQTFINIRRLTEENQDFLRVAFDDELKLSISTLDINSKFNFSIHTPKVNKAHKFTYILNHTPSSISEPGAYTATHQVDGHSVIRRFESWLYVINSFRSLNIHPNSHLLQSYKEQVFNSFSFIDDENNEQPLERSKQKQLSELLELTILELEKNDEVEEDIIEELKYLNQNISKLTQGQIKKMFSWTFAKILHLGIDAINNIAKVGKDAGITMLLMEGLKRLSS